MRVRRAWIGALLAALALGAVGSSAAESSVALPGHIMKRIRTATRLERLPAEENVELSLVVRLDQALLDQTLAQLYGPKAPAHKRFLSPAEFTRKFGLAEKRQKLKDFAQAAGLTVNAAEDRPGSLLVKVAGPASRVEKAFSVQLHRYRGGDGRLFRAHETEPMVPASLAPHLNAVLGLSRIRGAMKPHVRGFRPAPARPGATAGLPSPGVASPSALAGSGPGGGLAPIDIKTIYGLSGTLTGSGQSVALLEFDGYAPEDVTLYQNQFSLGSAPVNFESVDSQANLCGYNQNLTCDNSALLHGSSSGGIDYGMVEVALDIDMVLALAPGVSQVLVYTGNNYNDSSVDIYDKIQSDNLAQIISISWGLDEEDATGAFMDSESAILGTMATQGKTIYASAGDSGAYDASGMKDSYGSLESWDGALLTDDPASQTYVTAVGGSSLSGTSIKAIGSSGGPTESVWNGYWSYYNLQGVYTGVNTHYVCSSGNNPGTVCVEVGAGGGGVANYGGYWSVPSYQNQSGVLATAASQFYRNVPDVSLNADPNTSPYSICVGRTCNDTAHLTTLMGGTSAATPLWAALTALANQKLAANGFALLGFANPTLYQLATSASYASYFNDIKSGDNGYYQAVTGYDNASGWGSFKGDALINAVNALNVPSSAPQNFTATTRGISSMTWTWDSVARASSYNVYYGTNPARLAANVASPQVTLNFAPNTQSSVIVKAYNAAGEGPGGTSQSTATLALPLGSINSAVPNISSVTVTWTPCALNACAGYVLQASPNAGFSSPLFSSVTFNYAVSRLQVSGLSQMTNYHLRLGTLNSSNGANFYNVPGTVQTLLALVAPAPAAPEFANITAQAISFNWTRNGNPDPVTYQADCSSMAAFSPLAGSKSGSELYSAQFPGLLPNTSYYFRVQAVSGGPYLYAGPVATLAAMPTAAAAPFPALYMTSMTVAWSANGNAPDTLYEADLSAASDFSSVLESSFTRNLSAAFTSPPLNSNTIYYARVYASNRTGGASAPYVIGSTYTLIQQPVPVAQPFFNLSFDGFTFSFAGNNPAGTRYVVQVTTAVGAVAVAASSNTANGSASFSGLLSNQFYYASAAALNQAGTPTPFTAAQATATLVVAPLPLAAPVTARSSTTLGFAWGAGALAADTLYSARLSSCSSDFTYGVQPASNTYNTSAVLANLQPNTTYYARLRALSSSSDPDSGPVDFKPLAATLPTPPAAAAFQAVFFTSATVVWQPLPLSPSSAACEGYRLELWNASGFTGVVYSSTVAPGVSTATVSGLDYATTYYARVAALSPEGLPSYLAFGSAATAVPPISSGTVPSSGGLSLVLHSPLPQLTTVQMDVPAAAFPAGTNISAMAMMGMDLSAARSNEVAGLTPLGPNVGIELSAGGLQPASAVRLALGYDPVQVPMGQDPKSLRLFRYDPAAGQWTMIATQGVDVSAHTLTASIPHFSVFAPFFITAATGLSSVQVFPQPWEIGDAASPYWASALQFSNMPADARMRIFTVTGELMMDATASGGTFSWDGNNRFGHKAASGTYLVSIESSGQTKVRRVVLIR